MSEFRKTNKFSPRHFPRPRVLSLLQLLARSRWFEECISSHWRHPAGLLANDCANVYLWEKGTNVDGAKELDGEILNKRME